MMTLEQAIICLQAGAAEALRLAELGESRPAIVNGASEATRAARPTDALETEASGLGNHWHDGLRLALAAEDTAAKRESRAPDHAPVVRDVVATYLPKEQS